MIYLDFKNTQVLAKDAIKRIRCGKIRGERIFTVIERNSTLPEVYSGKAEEQMQSRDSRQFPQGYVRIRTDQGKTFVYDIFREAISSTQFEYSQIQGRWIRISRIRKAWILRSPLGTPDNELLEFYAERRILEERAFSLILSLPADLQSVAIQAIEDLIGLNVRSRPSTNEELCLVHDHYLARLSLRQLNDIAELLSMDGDPRLKLSA